MSDVPTAEKNVPYPVPTPHLTYHFWGRDTRPPPNGVTPERGAPRLYSINRAASMWRGELRVTLQGPMLKRDGTRGRHNRCCPVDLSVVQPGWLQALAADATARLTRVFPPTAPVRCAARCSQYPNCQHDWTEWESRVLPPADCPDCPHRSGAHHHECTVADCGCDRSADEFPARIIPPGNGSER